MPRILAILILAALSTVAETPADSKDGIPSKVEALHSRTSVAHQQLADWCASKKIHELAWREYRRAAELDPECAVAQKALGRKKVEGRWDVDPKAEVRKRNEGPPDTWQKAADEYAKKRAALASKAAKEYETLAQAAAKAGLEAEARGLWRELARCYDAKHEKANLALGFTRDGENWVGPTDVKNRAEAAKLIAAASAGKDVEGQSEIQRALKWKTTRRRSDHFLIEAALPAGETGQVVQVAEAARALFISTFGIREEDIAGEIQGVVPGSPAEFDTYIDCMPGLDADTRIARKYDGFARFYKSPLCWVSPGNSADLAAVKDAAIHQTSHFLSWRASPAKQMIPAWLNEGIAMWLSDRLNKTGRAYCTSYYHTDLARQQTEPLKWRRFILDGIREGTDPAMSDILSGEMTTLAGVRAVKAWSVVDWLTAARRDDLVGAWADLRNGEDLAKALLGRLGCKTALEMNETWEQWVDENY
jgi:hypothetical protein